METILVIAVAIPIIVAIISKVLFHHSITIWESLAQVVIVVLVVSLMWGLGRYSDARDVELWNGEVTGKEVVRKNCPWGWRDYTDSFCTVYITRTVRDGETCYTNSEGRRTCTPRYKTQYSYVYPWEQKFFVYTNIDTTFQFARVDRQGAITPDNFKAVYKGEPASARKSYYNWVRAASSNIFHEDGQAESKYSAILPEYPDQVYDYFRVNRVLTVGDVQVPSQLNAQLSEALRELGPQRQMNAVIIVADAREIDHDFSYALRRYWRGFKKNDAVVFLGMNGDQLEWTNVMSWSKHSIFDIEMRDRLLEQRGAPFDYNQVITTLSEVGMSSYTRRSMEEFEYLKSQIPTPTWLTVLVIMLSTLGSIGLAIVFHHYEFGSQGASRVRPRRISTTSMATGGSRAPRPRR